MKRIAILQSNYIPWKGYFDIIRSVDEFIIYDEVQFTKRDWRNRNQIKTKEGLIWLTIPVKTKGKYLQNIKDTEISGKYWADKHFDSIRFNYGSAPYFTDYEKILENTYKIASECRYLSEVNRIFIDLILSILNIGTVLTDSSVFRSDGDKNERILSICKKSKAREYLTGPAAKSYLRADLLLKEGISVVWADYNGYPAYEQLYPPYYENVTVLDLLFNTGNEAVKYMKRF